MAKSIKNRPRAWCLNVIVENDFSESIDDKENNIVEQNVHWYSDILISA